MQLDDLISTLMANTEEVRAANATIQAILAAILDLTFEETEAQTAMYEVEVEEALRLALEWYNQAVNTSAAANRTAAGFDAFEQLLRRAILLANSTLEQAAMALNLSGQASSVGDMIEVRAALHSVHLEPPACQQCKNVSLACNIYIL